MDTEVSHLLHKRLYDFEDRGVASSSDTDTGRRQLDLALDAQKSALDSQKTALDAQRSAQKLVDAFSTAWANAVVAGDFERAEKAKKDVKEAEDKVKEAEDKVNEAKKDVKEVEGRVKDAEDKVIKAEGKCEKIAAKQ